MTAPAEARILTHWDQFLAIEADWRDLHARAQGSLFSSFDWLVATEQAFGMPGRLAMVTLWQEGRLCAAAPLVEVRTPVSKLLKAYRPRMLTPFACKYSGFSEFLADGPVLYDRLCQVVTGFAGRRPVDLPMLRQGSGRDRLLAALRDRGYCLTEEPAFRSVVERLNGSLEDYLNSRGRNFRKSFRKAMTRLEEAGGAVEHVLGFGPEVLDRVRSVSKRSWKGTAGTGVGASDDNARFLQAICERLAPRDAADILFLTAGGADFAFCICLRHGDTCYGLWTEFDEAMAEMSPGRLSIVSAIDRMTSRGKPCDFDFVRRTHFTHDFSDEGYEITAVRAMPALGLASVLARAEGALRRVLGNRRLGRRKSVRRGDVV